MIFDGHTHYFSRFGQLQGVPIDQFVAGLNRQGITGAAVFTLEGFVRDDSRYYNDELYAVTRPYADFLFPFGTVHPRQGKAAVDEMERCVLELGMRGFKFHSWLQAFYTCGQDMFPIVEKAIELDVPLLFHDGTPPYSTTFQVAYLARMFPQAKIILGHSGLRDMWPEALWAALRYPNVVLQFCGTPPIGMRQMVKEVGPGRCVFGSDYPFAGEEMLQVALTEINELEISPDERQGILSENFRRLLKLC